MKAVLLPLAAFALLGLPAVAQEGDRTVAVQTPASQTDPSTVRRDDSLTFDLDESDASSAPLPAGTRDYEEATPSDVETYSDIEFDL